MSNRLFSRIPVRKPPRSRFDLSFESKFSCNMGDLIPCYCKEVLPSDRIRKADEIFVRFAPMLAPIMHRVNVFTHYFFVPNRLIFDKWEDFITKGVTGEVDIALPVVPYSNTFDTYYEVGSLADYLGIPPISPGSVFSYTISALPFRAYQLIYNEWYRNQNFQEEVPFSRGGGNVEDDLPILATLRRRNWQKDYFTSALPWPQRGGDVRLPLYGNAPVSGQSAVTWIRSEGPVDIGVDGLPVYGYARGSNTTANQGKFTLNGPTFGKKDLKLRQNPVTDGNGLGLAADLSNVSAATINELRRAIQLQKWFETNARGGSRYIEVLLSHFGQKSSDARLQRPEYLGGGRAPVQVSEVLQTSGTWTPADTGQETPQGNMAGHGVSGSGNFVFDRKFEEHGFVIGILSIMPKTAYQQGIDRMFRRQDPFDYAWPLFANLGEQEIKRSEIYAETTLPDELFGYQSRYAEYKYAQDTVHGEFRKSLDYWHLGRKFKAPPGLNATFVQGDPSERIFAVQSDASQRVEHVYVQMYHNVRAVRPLPYFGVPSL